MDFKTWLFLTETQQNVVELQVANYITQMIENSAEILKQDLAAGRPQQMFSYYVKQVWPAELQKGGKFLLPSTFPEGVAGKYVMFKMMSGGPNEKAETHHFQDQFDGFAFNIKPFRMMKTPEEVDEYVDALGYAVHHEAEHIYNPGTTPDDPDDDVMRGALTYMTNKGEVRGHAREMARAYAKHFPGEDFDLQKAHGLLDKSHFTNAHRNYFRALAEPGKWQNLQQKYPDFTDNPHDVAVQTVRSFLPQYQQ